MLADPTHSRIVLINPSRGFKAVRREALTLLPFAYDVFNVITHIIGEHDPQHVPEELANVSSVLGDMLFLCGTIQALFQTLMSTSVQSCLEAPGLRRMC